MALAKVSSINDCFSPRTVCLRLASALVFAAARILEASASAALTISAARAWASEREALRRLSARDPASSRISFAAFSAPSLILSRISSRGIQTAPYTWTANIIKRTDARSPNTA